MRILAFSRWEKFLPLAMILLAGAYVYAPVWHGDWLWDDDLYITQNDAVRSWAGLRSIWLAPTGVNYFPITATVQWLQWHLWHEHTSGYHLTNMGLHLVSAALVGRLLRQLGVRHSWIGGLLFVVHPVAVESVAWISELKNTLSLPFLLLAACGYVAFDTAAGMGRPARTAYLAALAAFVLAMLAKSTVAVFPALMLVFAGWRRGRISRRDLAAAAPFLAVSLLLGLVTVWFEQHRAIGKDVMEPVSLLQRLAVSGVALTFYLGKCLVPLRTVGIYPRWVVPPTPGTDFLPWLVLALVGAWLWQRRNSPEGRAVLLGSVWFGANLIPVLGLVPMAYQANSWVADHFAYTSLVGWAGLAAAGFGWWLTAGKAGGSAWPWLAIAAVTCGAAVESRHLAGTYRDGIVLWRHTLELNPSSATAHNNLGTALSQKGHFPEAIAEYGAAIRLRPRYADAHYNWGIALAKTGRNAEAVREYREALRLNPGNPKTLNNLGSALTGQGAAGEAIGLLTEVVRQEPGFANAQNNLGMALEQEDRLAEAIAHYREALRLDPGLAQAWNNLGNALAKAGRPAEALDPYREALRLQPDLAEGYFNYGNAVAVLGRREEAVAAYAKALVYRADVAAFHLNLAIVLSELGRRPEAIAHYRRATQLDPGSAAAHFDLANELFNSDQPELAVPEYEKALELQPGQPETLNNLGSALLKSGHPAEAIARYQAALRQAPDYADAHFNLGQAWRALGREAEAAEELALAARLDAARHPAAKPAPAPPSP